MSRRKPAALATDLVSLLVSGVSPPAVVTDEHDRILLWNRAAAQLLGHSASDVLGRRCYEVLDGSEEGRPFCVAHCPVKEAVEADRPVPALDLDFTCGPGQRRSLHMTVLGIAPGQPGPLLVVHLLEPNAEAAAEPREGLEALTAREQQVLQLVATGLQNKEIAQLLELSTQTVRNHVHGLLRKLGVRTKLEAISLAWRNGWVGGAPKASAP